MTTARSLLLLALAGCSTGPSSKVLIKAELVRLAGQASAAPQASSRLRSGTPPASLVRPWSSLLSISSFRGPVTQITLSGPTVEVLTLYECAGPSSDDCLVELNGPALQNLLGTAPVTVFPGTYDRVNMTYCKPPETGYHSFLTATVLIGGATWFTRTSGNLNSTGPAEPVQLPYAGCVKSYQIAPALVVTDTVSIPIDLRLYFDIRDIGFAGLGDPNTNQIWQSGPSGCSPVATPGVTPFVCAAYPDIAAVAGTVPPTEERYRVNGGATIGLLFDTGDRFVGGYFRRYAQEDQAWAPGFFPDSFADDFTSLGGGTYRLHQIGGATFPAFVRADHSGTATESGGHSFAYTAVRLP